MSKRLLFFIHCLFFSAALFVSCGPQVPTQYDEVDALPKIYPDYVDVTIPVNIAPPTFVLDEEADEMIARYSVGSGSPAAAIDIVCRDKMQPAIDDWRELVQAALAGGQAQAGEAKGGDIQADVYARHGDRWTHYRPFNIHVSPDSIDPWLSYRLIPPSFISYEALTINQRCLEDYDERVIYDNILCGLEKDGQCINCHSYQQYNPERMQFHARQSHGGTIIAYDIDSGEVMNIENDPDELEVFPAWSPDGRTLYYCSAHFVRNEAIKDASTDVVSRIDSLQYHLYRKTFDPETKTFGPCERLRVKSLELRDVTSEDTSKVSQPSTLNSQLSLVLPRISPDGRYLLFTTGCHGYFHIWHHDADLWMLDLKSGEARPLDEVNSPDTESYHTWSSSGRWIVFSSRRDDGLFTRPFFAHFDDNGRFGKPFELPSADPLYHREMLKSYNIPEFMHGPVTIDPHTFASMLKGEGEPVKYKGKE